MDNDQKKVKRRLIGLLAVWLLLALACFAVAAYLLVTKREAAIENERIITMTKIAVMTGIFFLVVALGYVLPLLLKAGNHKEPAASDIFQETNMRRAMQPCVPAGETLLAGIHAVAKETSVTMRYANCSCVEDRLVPAEHGSVLEVTKKKYAGYDCYIGITQEHLILVPCQKERYAYEFEELPVIAQQTQPELTAPLLLSDLGRCFLLDDIQTCETKKGSVGSIRCDITMKNGSYFKLLFPSTGGLGGGMPNHSAYREALLARLAK